MSTPTQQQQQTITLTAQCLCRQHTFTTTLPSSILPLKASSCHCTSCRHVTGALRSCDIDWPGEVYGTTPDLGTSGLKRYAHSARVDVRFCGRCGSGLFFEYKNRDRDGGDQGEGGAGKRYGVYTGVLGIEMEGGKGMGEVRPVVWDEHCFVGDTLDGGSAPWLKGVNGEGGVPPRVWLGRRGDSEEVKVGQHWPAIKDLPHHEVNLKAAGGDADNVHILCHCGGVDFVLRADEAQREFAEQQARGEELPWFVDPETHKFLGNLDACNSCRIWSGSEVYAWTFSLLKHISFAGPDSTGFPEDALGLKAAIEERDGKQRDPRLGTLAMYASSPDVQRYFCGRCSASVFYGSDDRPELVDIAVGLLDSPDGARAESAIKWSWGGQMGWRQDMMGTWREEFLKGVERDAEQWRIDRGYPKSWHRVKREQAAE